MAADSGFDNAFSTNSSCEAVNGLYFSCVCGMKYSRPGSTSRIELICCDTCLMLSMILLSSVQKIILLCLPINSTTSVLVRRSPSSSKCSISNWIIRSNPGCLIAVIRPFAICFRRSIQKFGAVMGLGLLFWVR